jgi:APA family basic amino acid/polyamine antiporter
MAAITSAENLKKEIGVRSLALASVNIMIGSGIFALPAIVAEGLGATAIVAYICCGALIFLLALCFAEAGSKTSKSGGPYHYIEEAFGPYAGFLAANMYLISCIAANAAIANVMADTLQYFFPGLGIDTNRMVFLFIIFFGLAWINISSVKNGLRFVIVASIAKLIPLIVLVIIAIPYTDTVNLKWTVQPTTGNIGPATLLLFFAFQGFEVPLSNGGEIKNPARTVPIGILMGILIVLVLYISIQLVTQGTLGDDLSLHKGAPLAAVGQLVMGSWGMVFIIIITIVSIFGSLSGDILSTPRMVFASASDGLLPKQLALVHPRFATPHIAILVYVAINFIMAISGGFKQLAIISAAASLICYLGVVLASVKLRRTTSYQHKKGFRIPGGLIVPLIATATIIWLLSNLAPAELTGISVFIGIFSAIYLVMTLVKRRKVIGITPPA